MNILWTIWLDWIGSSLLCDKQKDQNISIVLVNGMVFAEDLCDVPGLGNDYIEIALHYAQYNNQDNDRNNQNSG